MLDLLVGIFWLVVAGVFLWGACTTKRKPPASQSPTKLKERERRYPDEDFHLYEHFRDRFGK